VGTGSGVKVPDIVQVPDRYSSWSEQVLMVGESGQ
jgi:hypothetical protein